MATYLGDSKILIVQKGHRKATFLIFAKEEINRQPCWDVGGEEGKEEERWQKGPWVWLGYKEQELWNKTLALQRKQGKKSSVKYTGITRSKWENVWKDRSFGERIFSVKWVRVLFIPPAFEVAGLQLWFLQETATGAVVAENKNGAVGKAGWGLFPVIYYTNESWQTRGGLQASWSPWRNHHPRQANLPIVKEVTTEEGWDASALEELICL